MRLIDADLFSDKIRENKELLQKGLGKDAEFAFMTADAVLKLVENQPIAYDVDAVVKKLEDEEEQSYADFEEYAENFGLDEDDNWHYMGLKRAIETVKGGGVDNA